MKRVQFEIVRKCEKSNKRFYRIFTDNCYNGIHRVQRQNWRKLACMQATCIHTRINLSSFNKNRNSCEM